MEEEVRKLPAYLEGALLEREAKLAKRCKRMGVPAPVVTITNRWVEVRDGERVPFFAYAVTGESPRLEGNWQVVASVQHEKAGNIVNVAPAFRDNPPHGLISSEATCDHCNTKRARKMTVVLEKSDGTRARVGTDCIRDFVGHALPHVWETFADEYSFDEDSFPRSRHDWRTVHQVTAVALCAVESFGWVKSRDEFDRVPTHSVVSDWFNGCAQTRHDPASCTRCLLNPTDVHAEKAGNAIDWLVATTETDGYLANLRVAVMSEAFDKNFPLIVSLARAYTNFVEGEARRKAREEARLTEVRSDCPSGRITVTGIVVSTDYKENDFGVRHVMTVKDDSGFTAWGTVPSALSQVSVGDRVTFTANLEPSERDTTFGFYSRPSKARVLETA